MKRQPGCPYERDSVVKERNSDGHERVSLHKVRRPVDRIHDPHTRLLELSAAGHLSDDGNPRGLRLENGANGAL